MQQLLGPQMLAREEQRNASSGSQAPETSQVLRWTWQLAAVIEMAAGSSGKSRSGNKEVVAPVAKWRQYSNGADNGRCKISWD